MTISQFVPTLQPLVEQVNTDLRFICFFILTISIIVRTGTGSTDFNHLVRPLTTNAIICGFLALLPFWFNTVRDSFWGIAVQIQHDFTGSIMDAGTRLMQSLQPPDGKINWLDVSGSVWRAVQWALAWIVVWLGAIVQLPMMLFQYVMTCLCYLFLPIAISLFAFDGTKGIGLRYVQQTLAILAWPIGFAVVDLVGDSLLTSLGTDIGNSNPAMMAATVWGPAPFLVAGLVAIWLILGSLAIPIVMQALFCSGAPMSSTVGHAAQFGLGALGLVRLAGGGGGEPPASAPDSKGGSPSSPSTPPPAPSSSGGGGGMPQTPAYAPASSLPALMGPMQRAALPAPATLPALMGRPSQAALMDSAAGTLATLTAGPSSSPSPSFAMAFPPRGHTQSRSTPMTIDMKGDPSGTLYAASVMELNQIPTAISY